MRNGPRRTASSFFRDVRRPARQAVRQVIPFSAFDYVDGRWRRVRRLRCWRPGPVPVRSRTSARCGLRRRTRRCRGSWASPSCTATWCINDGLAAAVLAAGDPPPSAARGACRTARVGVQDRDRARVLAAAPGRRRAGWSSPTRWTPPPSRYEVKGLTCMGSPSTVSRHLNTLGWGNYA
ncbi:hypothetical protein HBB16_19465 [Pseudonocardia sp. MCCB 268]|nr:hypothetical protein [Pseudonocardia cytotoxica]